jgi:hypothetical protein
MKRSSSSTYGVISSSFTANLLKPPAAIIRQHEEPVVHEEPLYPKLFLDYESLSIIVCVDEEQHPLKINRFTPPGENIVKVGVPRREIEQYANKYNLSFREFQTLEGAVDNYLDQKIKNEFLREKKIHVTRRYYVSHLLNFFRRSSSCTDVRNAE